MDARHLETEHHQEIPRNVTVWAGRYCEGEEIDWHTHSKAQLLYAVEGVMRVFTRSGVWTIPSRRALLIPANIEHRLSVMSNLEMRTLYIVPEVADKFGVHCRAIVVSRLLRELVLGLVEEPPEYPIPGRGEYLAALILWEIGSAAAHAVEVPWPRDRRLQMVCQLLLNSPGNLTIEALAGEAGASARTLIRLFPKETGLKYRQWLQQVQIADALCRLDRGESIARIAGALGYASPSAFSAMFKRVFGVPPNQYFLLGKKPGQPQ